MCDIGLALTIGSTVLGAVGAIQQGQARASSNRYKAQVAEMNATLADRRSKDAVRRGQEEEQRKRREMAHIMGEQEVGMASSGVDIGFGSPLNMLVDTSMAGELDALTIRSNAYRESYDHQIDAISERGGARNYRSAADSASAGGYLDAFGTILGGASRGWEGYQSQQIGVYG